MSEIKLIVGLGNPGDKYAETRHNAGEWLIERLARRFNVSLNAENKFFGYVGKTLINGKEVRFLVPTTFMNLSGKAVGALANFYRIKPEEILVLHDELDLPPGTVKIKTRWRTWRTQWFKKISWLSLVTATISIVYALVLVILDTVI